MFFAQIRYLDYNTYNTSIAAAIRWVFIQPPSRQRIFQTELSGTAGAAFCLILRKSSVNRLK
jgi:hypothetical protein